MSEPKGKGGRGSPEEGESLGRYARKGGSARRAKPKSGFWQRVVDRIAPTQTAPTEAGWRRAAVELVLPDQTRVSVVVRAREDQLPAETIELELEPAPANDPRVLAVLAEVAHGAPAARPPEAPDSDDDLPIAIDIEPPEPAEAAARGQRLEADGEDLPLPPVAPAALIHRSAPTGPMPPLEAALMRRPMAAEPSFPPMLDPDDRPADASASLETVALDELPRAPTPHAARAAGVATSEIDLPDVEATATAAPPRRGPSRGGAARAFFADDDDAVRPAADSLIGHAETGPIPLRDRPSSGPTPLRSAAAPDTLEIIPPPPRPDPRRRHLPVIGIDFGTTYSSVAVMRAGIEVIPDETGAVQMPSVVSLPEPGVVLVGAEARARMAGAAQWTIASPKRLLGRLHRDPQVVQLVGGLAIRTFAGSDKFVRFEAHGNLYSVTDICAMILGKLRERACRFLDAEVSKAVLTVPVGFGTLQRSALELAARQAGLEIVGLLSEPAAAVLSHGFRGRHGTVAIYDFGGGTFDFSVLEVTDTAFQVLCAGGDTWLGGDDFDQAMAAHLADLFWNDTGVDLRTRAVEWQALVFACERAKRELSSKKEVEVRCDDLLFTQQGKRGLRYSIHRKKLFELTQDLIDKSILVARKVLSQAGVSPKQIDAVVLTGGTSFIPKVRETVTQFFGKAPVTGDPELAVAKGAALRGAELGGEAVAETSLGGRTLREAAGRTIGASVQGGPVDVLIERSAPLPAEGRRTYCTTEDGQTEMVIALYEEAKSRIDQSRSIGQLRYKGLRPAPRGQARVEFTFMLDEDGLLHVSAIVEGKQYDKSIKLDS